MTVTLTARQEFRRIGLTLIAGLLLTLLFASLWPVLIAVSVHLGYFVRQLLRLLRWTSQYESGHAPPEARGAWGELFDTLYRILRREMQTRHTLEQLISRAEGSVTALRDAVVVVDSGGRIEYWNTATERMLGLKSPQDKRQTLTNLVRDPRFGRYLHRGDFRQPVVIPAPHNDNLILECTITRFGLGDMLVIVRDITRLHNLEQMRKDFVANVSHELKTPLTVLKGYLETLTDSVPPEQKRLHRALEQMSQQSHRMELLVQDLLLLARLESTDADNNNQQVPLAPLLMQLRKDALALVPEKEHTLTIEADENARVIGDPAELQSAFGNLMTNAVKYTPPGGLIQIRWRVDNNGGYLSVQDNGIGIEAEHIPRLTERFYRPDDSRVTHTGGTGLGLAIVKHVMIRHGGQLEISSLFGKGSTFTCQFPLQRVVLHRELSSAKASV